MGDIIKLSSPAEKQSEDDIRYWEIPVLFEDEDLLVVDKPSSLLAVSKYSLVETLSMEELFRRDIERQATWTKTRENLHYIDCVFPLDADSTGVLVFAKNEAAKNFYANFINNEKNFRTFHALVHGIPKTTPKLEPNPEEKQTKSFRIHAGLIPHPTRPGTFKVDVKRGKKSITDVHVIETFNSYSYIECKPQTERMMQIRAHLRYIKCPVVCDPIYYGRPLYLSSLKPKYHPNSKHDERPLMGRTALHCSRVEIPHPSTGETIIFESPLPKDFQVSLKMLRKYGIRRWK